jgi:succinyl-diaminopimelate desuccinylase
MLDFSFEPYRQEMVEILKNFLKIESVKSESQPNMPYGKGIFDALMFVQSTAERMDLECVNLFGHMAYVDYGYGDEMLGILTHIDVVPKGDGWTMPAFEGIEKDGKIYGRGAIDDKGPCIAALYAIKALSDNCVQLNKKVRLIFGADEESGWADMDFYKQHEPLPDIAFSPDGEYPVINAEKGLMHVVLTIEGEKDEPGISVKSFAAGTRINVVPNKASCVIAAPFATIQKSLESYQCPIGASLTAEDAGDGLVRIVSIGKSAHGSRPEQGINAAASLLQYLGTLSLSTGKISEAIYALANKIGTYYHGECVELNLSDETSGKLTFNLGTLSLEDGVLKAGIDIRYPISVERSAIEEKLQKHFDAFGIEYKHTLDSHFVPEDSPLVTALKEAYSEITGEDAYCISIGGATYARAFENAVTFGSLFPGQPNVEHGPDEYIEIESLIKNAEIIANAIIKLCGETL